MWEVPDLADEDEIDISLTATENGFGYLKSWAHFFCYIFWTETIRFLFGSNPNVSISVREMVEFKI